MLETTIFLNFNRGRLRIPKQQCIIHTKGEELKSIKIYKQYLVTDHQTKNTNMKKSEIIKGRLQSVDIVIYDDKQHTSISATYKPKELIINKQNVLQVIEDKPTLAYYTFKDFAFEVVDFNNNPLILVKNMKSFEPYKDKVNIPYKELKKTTKKRI